MVLCCNHVTGSASCCATCSKYLHPEYVLNACGMHSSILSGYRGVVIASNHMHAGRRQAGKSYVPWDHKASGQNRLVNAAV